MIYINRKRIDKRYVNRLIHPIIFTDNLIEYPLIIEEWRKVDIDGVIKDYYFVNNFGVVKNIKGQILKPNMVNSGYLTYNLYTGTYPKYKTVLISRLVMRTFFPIQNYDMMTVDHIDMDPFNNETSNLEWVTQEENNRRKELNNCNYGSGNYQSTFSREQLIIIVNELRKNNTYSNILKILGIEDSPNNRDYIGNIKRGKTYQREIKEIFGE